MRMIPFECPNCGAQLNVVEGKTHMKCGWCGSDIMLRPDGNGVKASLNINVNVNVDRDEARIHEIDAKERSDKREHDLDSFVTKLHLIVPLVIAAIGAILAAVFFTVYAITENEGYASVGALGLIVFVYSLLFFAANDGNKKR